MRQMLCPRCDEQGTLHLVEILATGQHVYLCDDCDALWESPDSISINTFTDFSAFMKQYGLTGLWSEVKKIEAPPGK